MSLGTQGCGRLVAKNQLGFWAPELLGTKSNCLIQTPLGQMSLCQGLKSILSRNFGTSLLRFISALSTTHIHVHHTERRLLNKIKPNVMYSNQLCTFTNELITVLQIYTHIYMYTCMCVLVASADSHYWGSYMTVWGCKYFGRYGVDGHKC